MVSLMDRLLKLENLDLHLTPYKVLATGQDEGMLEFIPSRSLAQVFHPPKVDPLKGWVQSPMFINYVTTLLHWNSMEMCPLSQYLYFIFFLLKCSKVHIRKFLLKFASFKKIFYMRQVDNVFLRIVEKVKSMQSENFAWSKFVATFVPSLSNDFLHDQQGTLLC